MTYPVAQVAVAVQSTLQAQLLQQSCIRARDQLIEDVEVALSCGLGHDARLLQQIVEDVATDGSTLVVELNVHVLAKARGVVIAVRLGIAKGLQHGIALQQLILDALDGGLVSGTGGNILQDLLGCLRLAGTTFTRDKHALAAILLDEGAECVVRHRKAGED